MKKSSSFALGLQAWGLLCLAFLFARGDSAAAQDSADLPHGQREAIERAVARVRPSLVRLHVVSTYTRDGRELKTESVGSGAIISPDGHVITNHHVAGHATQIACTLSSREEIEAELVGADPLTDIAVIRLKPEDGRRFPVAVFGDSDAIAVGDPVLAMGSPLALSQSVTLGIVSNTEMIMPQWAGRSPSLLQDGEDVGALVKWIGHDAAIFGGNSGGPLVNLAGEIVGINEISFGLGGAIPGNLAQSVAAQLIENGEVERSWLGVSVQPRLQSIPSDRGVLVATVFPDSPAERAGLQSGDLLIEFAGEPIDIRYREQIPAFNRLAAAQPVGGKVEIAVLRDGREKRLELVTEKREPALPDETEIEAWGMTVRDLSRVLALQMQREDVDGVLVTTVGAGGPAGEAKPDIRAGDVIVEVAGTPTPNVKDLVALTSATLAGKARGERVPALTSFERENNSWMTVVKIGRTEMLDPGREVKKAWLPAAHQVVSRDIAEQLGRPELRGFRVTQVYPATTAERAGLKVGDLIFAVDDEPLEAKAPEDYEELPALIRQYKVGATVELKILRDGEEIVLPVELMRAPRLSREMKKYRNDVFEFTVRDLTFFDKVRHRWPEDQQGVMVEEVKSGGWAALGGLSVGDLLLSVDGGPIGDVESAETAMDRLAEERPDAVVMRVRRGIQTLFLEIEPDWRREIQP